MPPGFTPSDLKDTTVRRLALLCLAAATLTPVAVAVPPLLDHAVADQAPRPVAPRVTATAFSGIARLQGPPRSLLRGSPPPARGSRP